MEIFYARKTTPLADGTQKRVVRHEGAGQRAPRRPHHETAVETLHVLQSIRDAIRALARPGLRRQRASKNDWRERVAAEPHRGLRETGKVPTADALVRDGAS